MKRTAIKWHTVIILSMATAAMSGTAVTYAGPGCMSGNNYLTRGGYPYSPMPPQSYVQAAPQQQAYRQAMPPQQAYRQAMPYAYPAAPAPAMGRMAPRYSQPMMTQANYPGTATQPAKPAQAKSSPASTKKVAAGSQSKPAADSVTVRINGMKFQPAVLKIKPGTTVTWIQESRMPHTVSGMADGPRSATMYSGQKFSHTFDTAGSFKYVCDFHPSMKGSVIVAEPGVDT
jgi:plastocyanin